MGDALVDEGDYLRHVLDAIPAPLYVIGADLRIRDMNRAAKDLAGGEGPIVFRRLCGDFLRCANTVDSGTPCGETPACPDCVIRRAVERAARGRPTLRRKATMRFRNRDQARQLVTLLVTAAPFTYGSEGFALVILEDITELTELRRLLPMCAHCHRVRDEDQLWDEVEAYLAKHTNVELTHGLCPDCRKELYPDLER